MVSREVIARPAPDLIHQIPTTNFAQRLCVAAMIQSAVTHLWFKLGRFCRGRAPVRRRSRCKRRPLQIRGGVRWTRSNVSADRIRFSNLIGDVGDNSKFLSPNQVDRNSEIGELQIVEVEAGETDDPACRIPTDGAN